MLLLDTRIHVQLLAWRIELRHTNIPDEAFEDIVDGWNEVYFGSLSDFYDE
ncbi:MAG: hypothetical protein WAU36_04925 [Cyclobacteriaceae bacterium]